MKLSEFIKKTLEEYKGTDTTMVEFDVGLAPGSNGMKETAIIVDPNSSTRVKFTVMIRSKDQ